MKDGQNISPLNGLIRITIGLTLLAWAIAKLVRRPYSSSSYLLVAMCAGMKIGSGILRYCPFIAVRNKCFSLETYSICVSPIKDFLKETLEDMGDAVDKVTNNSNTETNGEHPTEQSGTDMEAGNPS